MLLMRLSFFYCKQARFRNMNSIKVKKKL